jgi:hypothetical protein
MGTERVPAIVASQTILEFALSDNVMTDCPGPRSLIRHQRNWSQLQLRRCAFADCGCPATGHVLQRSNLSRARRDKLAARNVRGRLREIHFGCLKFPVRSSLTCHRAFAFLELRPKSGKMGCVIAALSRACKLYEIVPSIIGLESRSTKFLMHISNLCFEDTGN